MTDLQTCADPQQDIAALEGILGLQLKDELKKVLLEKKLPEMKETHIIEEQRSVLN